MKKIMQKLTQQEAINQGYKYCVKYMDGEYFTKIENCKFNGSYVLCEKEPYPYQIEDSLILELLCDYLDNQTEVYDEDGHLSDAIRKVCYKEITGKVNEALAGSSKFYHPTDIFLMPNVEPTPERSVATEAK